MNKSAILITGARSIVALHMARSFASNGYDVHMADCSSALMARMSRVPCRIHRYASPRHRPDQFCTDVQRIMTEVSPAAVIPTCEEVFYLACARLAPVLKGRLFAPSLDILKTLHAKDYFISTCQEIGISTPETFTLTDWAQLDSLGIDTHEWVFKQRYSRFGATTLISPEKKMLQDMAFNADNPWIAQRRIHGTEISFYAIAKAGQLVAFAPYVSSWRLAGNASYAFLAVDNETSKHAQEFARLLAEKLDLTGQFSCDMIADAQGALWPLECNPRTTSGLHLLHDCAYAAALLPIDSTNCQTGALQPRYQLATFLTYGIVSAFAQARVSEWFHLLRRGRDVISAPGDRLPIIGAFIDALIFKCAAIKNKTTLSESTTADIEWNGEPLI